MLGQVAGPRSAMFGSCANRFGWDRFILPSLMRSEAVNKAASGLVAMPPFRTTGMTPDSTMSLLWLSLFLRGKAHPPGGTPARNRGPCCWSWHLMIRRSGRKKSRWIGS